MTPGLIRLTTRDSILARRDARWRLAALIGLAAVTVCLGTWQAAAVACGLALILAFAARVPVFWLTARVALLAPFIGMFALWLLFAGASPAWHWGHIRVSQHGLAVALLVTCKAVALLTLVVVGLVTAPLPETLAAAHALRVPGLLVQLTLLAYRYLWFFGQEVRRVRIALRTRGYRSQARLHSYRTIGHVAGNLLVRSHERAERVAQAMRCRGFDGRYRSLAVFGTSWPDVVLMSSAATAALAIGLLDWLER